MRVYSGQRSGNGGSLSSECRLLEVVEDFFLELKTISCDIVSVACDSVVLRCAIFDPFKSIDINSLKQEGTDEIWQLQLTGKSPMKVEARLVKHFASHNPCCFHQS